MKTPNSGSTIEICQCVGNGEARFDRKYICMQIQKKDFLEGCRRVIGIDGYFLKKQFDGILLMAVRVDSNNNQFPIAIAYVQREIGENWEWFLSLWRRDLFIIYDSEYTIMSDKQKDFIQAVQDMFLYAKHRFSMRHLHFNMKQTGF